MTIHNETDLEIPRESERVAEYLREKSRQELPAAAAAFDPDDDLVGKHEIAEFLAEHLQRGGPRRTPRRRPLGWRLMLDGIRLTRPTDARGVE